MERKIARSSIVLALLLALVLTLGLAGCKETGTPVNSGEQLVQALAAEGKQTVTIDENIVVTQPLTIKGEKTILGSGTITLNVTPAESGETSAPPALLGCAKLTAADLSQDAAVLKVESGASLTLGGSVIVDGGNCGNGIVALSGSTVTVTESATVQNGLGCGIYVCENATLNVQGGSLLNCADHGVINMGTTNVSGGTLSGTQTGAVIYSAGTLNISGGVVAEGGVHNVYVAAGSVTMTGGKLEWAEDDGLVVAVGATASVTGGTIENCGTHGLCNSGTMTTGQVTLIECGISNNATGKLTMEDTTVDISAVYCLSNLGGTVTAKNFSALSCDTTSICNFAGDMTLENLTVEGSRAGCISNESGNLTVNGATLGVCREKPINVGSGVVRMDNITIEGTTGEYFGAYIYGGELYLSNSTMKYINYSALRADGDCYVELTNVSIDDTMASGIWARGGTIVGNNLTLTNIRGHAVTNHGGKITITGMTATDVGKNAILMNNGDTVLTDVSFVNVGDQGAYIQNGTLLIENGNFENIAQNGVYTVPDGQSEVTLKNVNYTNIAKYGLNNGTKLTAERVNIFETGEAGVLNKKEMTLSLVTVKFTAKDCIYNDINGNLTAIDVFCYHPSASSNPVYNRGHIYAFNLNIQKSFNYGIRNKGYITGNGLHIWDVEKVGLYNEGGRVNQLNDLTVNNSGDHAINNTKGTFSASNVKLTNINGEKSNAIYNYGTMELTGLVVDGVKSHAVFNKGSIVGSDFTISNAGDVGFNNNENAVADLTNVTVTGSTHGVYNIAQLKLTNATLTDPSSNGIFNKGGDLELNGTVTVTGSKGHGLCHNEGTVSGSATLVVNNISGNGLYNAKGEVALGDVVVDGAKYGISNAGTTSVGAVSVSNCTMQGIHNSGKLYAKSAKITDICGTTNGDNQGNGIYNTKELTIGGDLVIDKITSSGHTGNASNNGIFNRGALEVTGNVTIGDVKAGHAVIGTAGTINFPGTVTINGTVGKDNILYFYSSAKTVTIGALVKTSDVAKVVLKVDGSTKLTVNGGQIKGGSGKDIVVSNGSAVVTLNNVTLTGGNNALHGAGGDIVANNVAISGGTIGINIRNANSQVTVKGNSTITDATHGSSVHVNSKGKLTIDGGKLTIGWSEGKTGQKNGMLVYSGSTLELVNGGQLIINGPKTGIKSDSGNITGDAASGITVSNVAADGYAIENYGKMDMKGTVTVSGAAGSNALVKAMNDTTIGVLNRADNTAREVLRAEKEAVVSVSGGTVQGGSGKDVIVASNTSVINVSNMTINGGNNMLYGAGGDIVASNVTLNGGSIAINIRNANSQVTLQGVNTISNTTHGTCIHINSTGKLVVAKDAKVTLQWTQENLMGQKVGIKIYKNSTLIMEDNSSLTMVDASKGWNTEAGYTFTRGTGATVTVNGTAA